MSESGAKPPLSRGNSRKSSNVPQPPDSPRESRLVRGNSKKDRISTAGGECPQVTRKTSKGDDDTKRSVVSDEQRAIYRNMTLEALEREMQAKTDALNELGNQVSDIFDPPVEIHQRMEQLDRERTYLRILRDEKKKAAVLEPLRYCAMDPPYMFSVPDSITNIVLEDDDGSGTPRVKGASKLKLVERLTYDEYTDHNFQRQFLLTFRTFSKPEELLQLLIARYNIGTPKSNDRADEFAKKIAAPIKLRVLNVIKRWVEQHFDDFAEDPALLQTLRAFLDSLPDEQIPMEPSSSGSSEVRPNMKRILKLRIDEAESKHLSRTNGKGDERRRSDDNSPGDLVPPPSPSPSTVSSASGGVERKKESIESQNQPIPILPMLQDDGTVAGLKVKLEGLDIMNFHPMEIARQMTLIEYELYRSISPHDLSELACNTSAENASPIVRFIDRFNVTSMWATTQIVSRTTLQTRKEVLTKLIDIAECCFELNNFNGLYEIISSLQSAPVHRLKHTWTVVPTAHKERFEELVALTSNTNNSRDYRKLIASINPPCIPYIGIYMTDLTFIRDGNPNCLPGTDLINFTKRRMISAVLTDMLQYQQTPYNFAVVPVLRSKLEEIGKGNLTEQDCYKKSLIIEPRNAAEPLENTRRIAFIIDTLVKKASKVWAQKLLERVKELFGELTWTAFMITEETFEDQGPKAGKAGANVMQYRTTAAQKAALAVQKNYDAIVIVGNGITVNQALEGYLSEGGGTRRIPFGIIPIGDNDDFVKTVNIPTDPLDALACVFDGMVALTDVGVVQAPERGGLPQRDRYFLNVCSVGTESTRLTDLANRALVGRASLLLQSVTHGSKANNRATRLKIDDSEWMNCNMFELLICNGRYSGGFEVAIDACMTDGQFDIVLLEDVSMLEASRVSNLIRRGDQITSDKNVHLVRGTSVVVEGIGKDGAKLAIEADGEMLGALPAKIFVLPEAVALIVPRTQNTGRADSVVTRRASVRNLAAMSLRRSSSLTGLNLQENLAKRGSIISENGDIQDAVNRKTIAQKELMRSASDTLLPRPRSITDPPDSEGTLSRSQGKGASSLRKKKIVPFGVALDETLLREKSEIPRACDAVERYMAERGRMNPQSLPEGFSQLIAALKRHGGDGGDVGTQVNHLRIMFDRRKDETFEISQEYTPDVALAFLRHFLLCLPVPVGVGVYSGILEAAQVTDIFAEGTKDGWRESRTREAYIDVLSHMQPRNRSVLAFLVGFLRQYVYERSPTVETLKELGRIFASPLLGSLTEANVYHDDSVLFDEEDDDGPAQVLQTLVVFWDELLVPFIAKR